MKKSRRSISKVWVLLGFFPIFASTSLHEPFNLSKLQQNHIRSWSPPGVNPSDDPWISRGVHFWTRIYTEFSTSQGVIHDSKFLDIVYEVVDISNLTKRQRRKKIRQVKKKWKSTLEKLHRQSQVPGPFSYSKLTDEEKRVFQSFLRIKEKDKFKTASKRRRLRFQLGQKDQFREGMIESGKYIKKMEEIFIALGLPVELTRLPFVESSFRIGAHSKVGAKGIWQFMHSTGKRYLQINSVVDERLDPLLATRAAAQLLKRNYEVLGRWDLALTAYNHGRRGMQRAVSALGSQEIRYIADHYQGTRFGFASRNFYLQLLAAIEVEKNATAYFGHLERESPQNFVRVGVADFISAKHLLKHLKIEEDEFRSLNPGFKQKIFAGEKRIPRGYVIRIPEKWGLDNGGPRTAFWTTYNKIPSKHKFESQVRVRIN